MRVVVELSFYNAIISRVSLEYTYSKSVILMTSLKFEIYNIL